MAARLSYTAFTRAKSSGLSVMESPCAVSLGLISVLISSSRSVVFDPVTAKNTRATRPSMRPDFSSATMVLLIVGGAGLSMIAWISAFWIAMPCSKAGR